VYLNGGIFRLVSGTVYGTDASPSSLANTATQGMTLFMNAGTATWGTGTPFTTPPNTRNNTITGLGPNTN
jgi:hypothetical protein